jgi:hypothetical protein
MKLCADMQANEQILITFLEARITQALESPIKPYQRYRSPPICPAPPISDFEPALFE